MICRIWHGVTEAAKADEYADYMSRTGLVDYKATKGNRGAFILRRIEGDRAHFLTLSLWDSVESIREFAGEDYERARYYPEDDEFLLEREPQVYHYEIYNNSGKENPMSETAGIIDELKTIYDGDPLQYGSSLKESLAGITPAQAAARPVPGAHNIWEIAAHIAGWNNVFSSRREGTPMDEPEDGDFPPVTEVTEAAWSQTLEKIARAQDRLERAVARWDVERSGEIVPGREFTFGQMLCGLVRHNVYHAGQIALLKKA